MQATKSFRTWSNVIVFAGASLISPQCFAYLGGFEANDGYLGFVNWVNTYNAGQYGTANGGIPGSVAVPASPPSHPTADYGGLWDDKNDNFATYNVHPIVFAGGYYVTGHNEVTALGMVPHSGLQMLALRNTTYATLAPINLAGPQPLDYRYTLDTRDFYNGGSPVNPVNTGNKVVDWSVWAGPGPSTAPGDGIWLSFLDSTGHVGFQFGWDESYLLRHRNVINGKPDLSWTYLVDPFTNTGYVLGRPWARSPNPPIIPPQNVIYDRFDFSLNLLHDTWSLDVESGVDSKTRKFVTDLAFGEALSNFTNIDWHVSYGNEKGFFDDSQFEIRNVPEPGTYALLAIAGPLLWRVRSRRKISS